MVTLNTYTLARSHSEHAIHTAHTLTGTKHGVTFASLNHLINSIMGPLSIFRLTLLPNWGRFYFLAPFRSGCEPLEKRSAAQIIDFSLAATLFLALAHRTHSVAPKISIQFLFGNIPRYICMPSTITEFNSSVNISFVRFLHIRFCGSSIHQHCARNQTEDVFHGNAIFGFRISFVFFVHQIKKPYSSHHRRTLCSNSSNGRGFDGIHTLCSSFQLSSNC